MVDDSEPSAAGYDGEKESSGRLYNPYADLYAGMDAGKIDKLYRLPDSPEFLFTEEAAIQRRSFGDNLTFYTGCGWLGGAIFGGAHGLVEGVRLREEGDTTKIRINRILNSSGHRGRVAANTLGVLGLLYGGLEGAAVHFRSTDDVYNSIIAGLGTGALYKAAAGPRTAVIAGAVGGITAAAWTAGKQVSKRYLSFSY